MKKIYLVYKIRSNKTAMNTLIGCKTLNQALSIVKVENKKLKDYGLVNKYHNRIEYYTIKEITLI